MWIVWTKECNMCELLAMSTSHLAKLTFSLHALASHGAQGSTLRDGWGVAFYQDDDVALFREPFAASESALIRYLESQGPYTNLAISHIRHATQGLPKLSNTQPFTRELGGSVHVFAHNGNLTGIDMLPLPADNPYRVVGETDSEQAFCLLLARLSEMWREGEVPALGIRLSLLARFAADLSKLGPANFLYADGDALFVHGHRRLQKASRRAEPPGLWMLQRHCACPTPEMIDCTGVSVSQESGTTLLFASVPLTEEAWSPLAENELLAVRRGAVIARHLVGADAALRSSESW